MKSLNSVDREFGQRQLLGLDGRRTRCFFLVISFLLFSVCVEAKQLLIALKVTDPPEIDGSGGDDAWRRTGGIITRDKASGTEITIKAVYTDKRIFFLVRFPDPDESRQHKLWVWNADQGLYVMGPQREDCFVFKWAMEDGTTDLSLSSDVPYLADIWFWKAERTDSQGYADDKWQKLQHRNNPRAMPVESKTGSKMFLLRRGDLGQPAYRSVIQMENIGETVRQYTYRKPTGSRANVQAKGSWKEGTWGVEFTRLLKTGESDDVGFDVSGAYLFGVSLYEIAGKKPDPRLSNSLYGSGDVGEKLILKFVEK